MKHTKGPWHLHNMEKNTVCGPKGFTVAVTDMYARAPIENKANARLIAAAPELLEVCKIVVKWWKKHQYDIRWNGENVYNARPKEPEMVIKAKQAIAKAEES